MTDTNSPPSTADEDASIFLRRTDLTDAPKIATLVREHTEQLFGESNIVSVIERAVLSITVVDQLGGVVGHASFFDYPNIAGVRSSSWEEWMVTHYEIDVVPVNSLFLRFFVAAPAVSRSVVRELLHTVFVAVPDVLFCALPVPAGCDTAVESAGLSDFLTPATPATHPQTACGAEGGKRCGTGPLPADSSSIYVCHRSALLPRIGLRVAAAEDNDDLASIFAHQNETLHERFGEFYLTNLIEAQDSSNRALAIEVDGKAAGLMSVSTRVDTALLREHYQLDVFHGLQALRPAPDQLGIGSTFVPKEEGGGAEEGGAGDPRQEEETPEKAQVEEAPARRGNGEKAANGSPMTMTDSVISIGLFAIAEAHEMRSLEFLRLAFSLFPAADYCVCSLPHNMPVFPLLHNFTRVPQSPRSRLHHELYVFHRYGLLRDLQVRVATAEDVAPLADGLLASMENREVIAADVARAVEADAGGRDPDGVKVEAYVATVRGEPVGIAVLRDARRDALLMRSHFNIEDFVLFAEHMPREHANLHHFCLNPIFNRFGKTFLREVMRQSEKTCVYHRLYTPGTAPTDRPAYTPTQLLSDMVAVRRRRQPL